MFKPKSATDNRDNKADIKTIPQPQGDIRHKHKTNSNSSERQYIAKVRETVFTLHCMFEFETRMGESLIDLVRQYPALWDKQNSKYKDSNYKDAKWREICEMLGVPKDDAIKKWKSLRDTYVRQKNIKSKSGDGLSDSKPRWKYYAIMSFLDVTLLIKGMLQIFQIYIHTFMHIISVM